MILPGRVENGVVVFLNHPPLLDGTLVEVRPLESETKSSTTAPVSEEPQEALRRLIGIWKTEKAPSDDEVQRMLEQEIMTKYG